jgi:hypothetical protein
MKTIATILALGAILTASAYAEPELTTRRFRVLPSIEQTAHAVRGEVHTGDFVEMGGDQHVINEADWKEFFAQLGMTWPEGSSIRYVPSTGHMVVKSTPDNLDLFEKIISVPDCIPTQIEVEMQYVQFDREVIDSLSSKTEADASALLEMWRSGKGELVWAPRLLTQSGTEAMLQAQASNVRQARHVPDPAMGQTNTAVRTVNSPFVQVLPEVSPEGQMINVSLTCDVVTTVATVIPGKPILLGGGYPAADKEKLLYVFLTVRLVDVEGDRLKEPEMSNKTPGHVPSKAAADGDL